MTEPDTPSSTAASRAATRGLFISLEGSEGVGKTTNLRVIETFLRERGVELVVTREPGGTPLGERVREVLLHAGAGAEEPPMTAMAELLLMFAARAQHVATVIEPALAAGRWVLSDRFTDASFAYQGGGRGLDASVIAQLETLVQGPLRPDLTIYLDIDPRAGFSRIADRALDRIEQESLAFFDRVRACYLERANAEPGRFACIDAAPGPAVVAETLRSVLQERLPA